MPATLTSRLASSGSVDLSAVSTEIVSEIIADGTLDDGAARVAVQLSMPLSFSEVLGLLAFAPSDGLTYETLEGPSADTEVRWTVTYALMNTPVWELHDWAQQAAAALKDSAVNELTEFVKRVAPIVTRVFGLTAPLAA